MALRKKQDNILLNLKPQEFEDVLSAITFTQTRYERDAPQFLMALEKLRVKFWATKERQIKKVTQDG